METPHPARGGLRPSAAPRSNWALKVFPLLCLLWFVPRLRLGSAEVPAALVSTLAAVRAAPSPSAGCYELTGLPAGDAGTVALFDDPRIAAARARLEARVAATNDELRLLSEKVAERIEVFPDDGVAAIQFAGSLEPFYGMEGSRLARARREASERPHSSLRTVAGILGRRLSEPAPASLQEGISEEDPVVKREVRLLFREIDEALQKHEEVVAAALEEFRKNVLEAARQAQGPFRRQGTGRIVEIILASLLGVILREALRPGRGPVPAELAISFAPVLAAGVVLGLEGSALLPVDPLRGVSPAFAAIAFVLGFACARLIAVASRLSGLLGAAPEVPAAAPAAPAPPLGDSLEEVSAPAPARPAPTRGARPPAPAAAEPAARPTLDHPGPRERELPEDPALWRDPEPLRGRGGRPVLSPGQGAPPAREKLPFFERRPRRPRS